MLTVPDIIHRLGGPTKFGQICGFSINPGQRGYDMRSRDSIPAAYWLRIVEAAREIEGAQDITLEALAELHAEKAKGDAA